MEEREGVTCDRSVLLYDAGVLDSNRARASEIQIELKTESEAGRENGVRECSARSYKQNQLPEGENNRQVYL